MSHYDCDETDLAVKLYFRKHGRNAMQPSRQQSGLEGDKIVLRGGDRILETYWLHDIVKEKERLQDAAED